MRTDNRNPVTKSFGRWVPNYVFAGCARDIDEAPAILAEADYDRWRAAYEAESALSERAAERYNEEALAGLHRPSSFDNPEEEEGRERYLEWIAWCDAKAIESKWEGRFTGSGEAGPIDSGTCPGCGKWSDYLSPEGICDRCLTKCLERGMG